MLFFLQLIIIDPFLTSDHSMVYFELIITQSHQNGHHQQQLSEFSFARAY